MSGDKTIDTKLGIPNCLNDYFAPFSLLADGISLACGPHLNVHPIDDIRLTLESTFDYYTAG